MDSYICKRCNQDVLDDYHYRKIHYDDRQCEVVLCEEKPNV